jgi:tRNA-2-methylthio-N6-dimethylallyladenosine synthase
MKRGYSVEQYREMLSRVRATVPDAAVSSDFIVGFCGETEAEFQQTVELVEDCRFKNSFIFKYSVRPGTKAAERLTDDVPWEVKQRRNNDLLAVQNAISEQDNQLFLGETCDVLVEGPSKLAIKRGTSGDDCLQLTGRTACDRIVVFDGTVRQIGELLPVAIIDATAHTLFGQVVNNRSSIELPIWQPA